jgi:transcriptional regulator with XRE-family HTH domain
VKLRTLRDEAGLTQEAAARECTVSRSMFDHYENRRRLPSLDFAKKADILFGTGIWFEEHQPLVVAEAALPTGAAEFFDQEAQAISNSVYEPLVITGLLQTPAYARVVLAALLRDDQLDDAVSFRLSRQDLVSGDQPAELLMLVREQVLREIVGNRDIMREQLQHLLELCQRPNITIQVIPTGAPIHLASGLTLLGFDEGGDLAYSEGAAGGILVEAPDQVNVLTIRFARIRAQALSGPETEQLIRAILESL